MSRPTPSNERQHAGILLAVLTVALAARVAVAWWLGLETPPPPGSDQFEYDAYAWNLAQGNGYRGPSPDVADQNHLTAYRPPVPSLVMAAVYVMLGHHYAPVRLLHCLLGTASVWLTYRIGRQAYGRTVGLVAAAVYAVFPAAVLQSGDLTSEPVGVFLFLLFVERALAFAANGKWLPAGGTGVSLGLALLARSNYVLVIPLFVLWALVQFRSDRHRLAGALGTLLIAGTVMTPWVVRNQLVFGRFIPFSTTAGSALLQGNNRLVVSEPHLQGYCVWDTQLEEYREALQSAGDEIERDRRARQFAIEWLRNNPDKWLLLAQYKFVRSWTPFLAHNPSPAHRALYLATWGPILLLFAMAYLPTLIASLRTGSPAWLIHVVILHYVANSIIFFAIVRYRAPIDPLCIVLASQCALWLVARFTRRSAACALPPNRAAGQPRSRQQPELVLPDGSSHLP